MSSGRGLQSWRSPANGSSISASTPATLTIRLSSVRSAGKSNKGGFADAGFASYHYAGALTRPDSRRELLHHLARTGPTL